MYSALSWAASVLVPDSETGAIDIILVRGHDGTSLQSSPWHVRFPKASSKSTSERREVRVCINGAPTGLWMKVGSAGEAFFVERTSHRPSSEGSGSGKRSSPIMRPASLTDEEGLNSKRIRSFSEGFLEPDDASEALEPRAASSSEVAHISLRKAKSFEDLAAPVTTKRESGLDTWTWDWGEIPVKTRASVQSATDVAAACDHDGGTDEELSLHDVSLDEISPEPALGDLYESDSESYCSASVEGEHGARSYRFRKSVVPKAADLLGLQLKDGENTVSFEVDGAAPISAKLFVWRSAPMRIVVVDVDATLERNRAAGWGGLLALGSRTASEDAVELLSKAYRNGYSMLYIAGSGGSGALQLLRTANMAALPPGPVLSSPDSLVRSAVDRREFFRAAALRGVSSLFSDAVFHAALAANVVNATIFSRCGVEAGRTFLIAPAGGLRTLSRTHVRPWSDLISGAGDIFPTFCNTLSPGNARQHVTLGYDAFNNVNFWRPPTFVIE